MMKPRVITLINVKIDTGLFYWKSTNLIGSPITAYIFTIRLLVFYEQIVNKVKARKFPINHVRATWQNADRGGWMG